MDMEVPKEWTTDVGRFGVRFHKPTKGEPERHWPVVSVEKDRKKLDIEHETSADPKINEDLLNIERARLAGWAEKRLQHICERFGEESDCYGYKAIDVGVAPEIRVAGRAELATDEAKLVEVDTADHGTGLIIGFVARKELWDGAQADFAEILSSLRFGACK